MTDLSQTGGMPAHAGFHAVSGETPAGVAVSLLLSGLAEQISRTGDEFVNDTSPDALHDYRIAVRRTLSLLAQMRGVVPGPVLSRYRGGFSSVMDKTGLLRDLEVCRGVLDGYMSKHPGIGPLYERISARELAERRRLKAYFRTKRYRAFRDAWAACLQSLAQDESFEHDSSCPVRELARDAIQARYLTTLRHASRLDGSSSSNKFHKMRKSAKKLRYLLDHFGDLYPDKAIRKIRKRMKQLQSCLGDIQDLEVQSRLIRETRESLVPAGKHRKAVDKLLKHMKRQKKALKKDSTGLVAGFPRTPGKSIETLLARY